MLIGVDQTGDFPKLKDAASGARRVKQWADSQDMEPATLITDDRSKPVTYERIKKAIWDIVGLGTIDQLVVYFAGHGANVEGNERWLLSGAPRDTGEAVNMAGSELLARYCGIPHVVLISDACRTAAEGVRAQLVKGRDIFPNDLTGDLTKPVDQFWACALGRTAVELSSNATAEGYRAIFTESLLHALNGGDPDLLDEAGVKDAYIRPRPLKRHLEQDVPRRIAQLGVQGSVLQVPDAIITSDERAWISRLGRTGHAAPRPKQGRRRGEVHRVQSRVLPPPTTATLLGTLIAPAIGGNVDTLNHELNGWRRSAPHSAEIADSLVMTARPFGELAREVDSGFGVRGARIAEIHCSRGRGELLAEGAAAIVHDIGGLPGASVLLVFESGTGVVLPVIPGFFAGLTLDENELVDVAYEPSAGSRLADAFKRQAREFRALRAVASTSTRNGAFRLRGEQPDSFATSMLYDQGPDPTLAVYAAYAYLETQRLDLIRDASSSLYRRFDFRVFDVALLAGELEGRRVDTSDDVMPFVPMLSRGWALLSALRVELIPAFKDLEQTLVPSVWTMFGPEGVELVRSAVAATAVQ